VDPAAPDHPTNARWQALRRRAVLASVAMAGTLAATKLVVALMSGSVAVLASLADSLADVAASSLALWSVVVANRPADEDHRFGHGKAEAISSLVQAALVGGSGVFVVYSAVGRLLEPEPLRHTQLAIGVMVLSTIGSVAIVAIQSWTLRRVDSVAIEADSLHYRGDVLANLSVIVAIVIAGRGELGWVDPLVGALIAGYLFLTAFSIVRNSVDLLMDRELPEPERERIAALVMADPDARGLHDLRTRSLGQGVHVELHLELDGDLDLHRSHAITDRVERSIASAYPGSEVTIHTEPAGLDDERLDDRLMAGRTSDKNAPSIRNQTGRDAVDG
jgi:ferrous-iron efflux pump FieF